MATHVAHHFDDAEQQFEAATLGMWIFLVTEVMFFGGMFTGYTVYRWLYPVAFAEGSGHLDLVLGSINTAVLLTSSLSVALAVRAAHCNDAKGTVRNLLLTIVLGATFLGIKGYEYWHKWHEHLIPGRNFSLGQSHSGAANPDNVELFFSFYFAMTGLHAAHMIIGVGAIAVTAFFAWRGKFSSDYYTPVELTGLYWHFVDLVWVFLFPLLYLVG